MKCCGWLTYGEMLWLAGDLVVTKGDQYDVREKSDGGGDVRNLGKPVALKTPVKIQSSLRSQLRSRN